MGMEFCNACLFICYQFRVAFLLPVLYSFLAKFIDIIQMLTMANYISVARYR